MWSSSCLPLQRSIEQEEETISSGRNITKEKRRRRLVEGLWCRGEGQQVISMAGKFGGKMERRIQNRRPGDKDRRHTPQAAGNTLFNSGRCCPAGVPIWNLQLLPEPELCTLITKCHRRLVENRSSLVSQNGEHTAEACAKRGSKENVGLHSGRRSGSSDTNKKNANTCTLIFIFFLLDPGDECLCLIRY